jgi:hypothetical protein
VSQDRFAGIIGLAPRSSESQLGAFIDQVKQINFSSKQDALSPLFSFYLSRNPSEDGRITFGGYDIANFAQPGKKEADIFWGKAVPYERYWTLPMNKLTIAGKKGETDIPQNQPRYAIMDTGVSYAIIPSNDFDKVKNSLADYGVKCSEPKDSSLVSTQKCQCSDYSSLPDIQMTLMDKDTNNMKAFSLPKESYMEKAGGNGCNTLRLTSSTEHFGRGESANYWVLGAIFLQNYYSIYDFPNNLIGLIEAKG